MTARCPSHRTRPASDSRPEAGHKGKRPSPFWEEGRLRLCAVDGEKPPGGGGFQATRRGCRVWSCDTPGNTTHTVTGRNRGPECQPCSLSTVATRVESGAP